MNQTSEFFRLFLQESGADEAQPTATDVAASLQDVRERGRIQRCVPRARLFREASSGWKPEFQQEGHATHCADCESAAFIALRTQRPGLWIVAPEEQSTDLRP